MQSRSITDTEVSKYLFGSFGASLAERSLIMNSNSGVRNHGRDTHCMYVRKGDVQKEGKRREREEQEKYEHAHEGIEDEYKDAQAER